MLVNAVVLTVAGGNKAVHSPHLVTDDRVLDMIAAGVTAQSGVYSCFFELCFCSPPSFLLLKLVQLSLAPSVNAFFP